MICKAAQVALGDKVSNHNLRLARHAVNEYGGWVNVVIWFRLSHKPRRADNINV